MKTSEKLRKKLEEMGLKPIENPERLYHGYWQRSNGAMCWICKSEGGLQISSMHTMEQCLKATNIEIYVSCIDPFVYELIINEPIYHHPKPKPKLYDHSEMDRKLQEHLKKYM